MLIGFLTGSHRYGKPTERSDLDLCLLVTHAELAFLDSCCDSKLESDPDSEYPSDTRIFRFGKLNLLCFIYGKHEHDFFAFGLGTEKMLHCPKKHTENRELAVDTIQTLLQLIPQTQESVQ